MNYMIGQLFGIVAAICCLISPFLKHRWQMLSFSAIATIFTALNLILIGQMGSAVILNFVAVVQIAISIRHIFKNTKVTLCENIIFLIAYVVLGIAGYQRLIDILPIFGAVIFMLTVFMRSEQKSRLMALLNALTYLIYYLIIGSASALAQVVGIVTNVSALIIYKNLKGQ